MAHDDEVESQAKRPQVDLILKESQNKMFFQCPQTELI